MATITITINDAHLTRVVDAFSTHYDYIENRIDENETENQFAKRMLAEHAKMITRRVERQEARNTATAGITDTDIT